MWAGPVFILIGLILAVLGMGSIVLRFMTGNLLAVPTMIFEGGLVAVGILAIIHGARSLIRPGKT
jgi:hypothetical protein